MIPAESNARIALSCEADVFSQILGAVLPNGNGILAVIRAYFDESGTHPGSPLMCVAGYLFDANAAALFDNRWGSITRQAGLAYFRMSDCAGGFGEFKNWPTKHRIAIEKELIALIRANMTFGVGVVLSQDDYEKQQPEGWTKHYGHAYTLTLTLCLAQISKWVTDTGYSGEIAYFFESGHEHAQEANDKMQQMDARHRESIRYASHTFIDKRHARPCDAADFLAWHLKKYSTDAKLGHRPTRKDLLALMNKQDDRYGFWGIDREQMKLVFDSQPPPPR